MWKMSHWVRWRQFHYPLEQYGHRVAMGLFLPWYWHLSLSQGGTLILIPMECNINIPKLVHFLSAAKAHWVDCLTPGQLAMATELCAPPLPVTHVMCSGEALPLRAASAFLSKFGETTLSNVLSTTETSADICALKSVSLELCEELGEQARRKHG